jgi:hypothetical protein
MKNQHRELCVNEDHVELNQFAGQFLENLSLCAAKSLKSADEIKELEFLYRASTLTLVINGNSIPLSDFPHRIITNTLMGLISSFKGIDKIESFRITIKA